MATKALGNFGGIYYDQFYGGLKTDLARKQAQGKLTSGAYPMSPEEYAAAYYGISKGEQEARAAQQQYELQKKQGMADIYFQQKNLEQQKATSSNPVVGATNLLTAAVAGTKAINSLVPMASKAISGILPTTTTTPESYYDPTVDYYTDYPISYDEYYGGYDTGGYDYGVYDIGTDYSSYYSDIASYFY